MIRKLTTALAALVLSAAQALSQGLIRDAEIEYALAQVARPILAQAGLPSSTKIYIVNDNAMNAFVANARAIFITSGLLMRLETADQVQAVIAHEAAHIVNGHLTRRPAAIRSAQNTARLGLILAAAAAAAGGGSAGFGVLAGTSSAAQRSLFAHTRAEEASADQSGLRFMAAAGTDPQAAREVLELFRGQELLSANRQDAYAQTHPLTRDRIRAVEGFAAAVTPRTSDRSATDYWYARANGKMTAFLRAPGWTLRRAGQGSDEVSVMRRAIAHHREPDQRRAMALVDALIAARPNDPYYHELRGQFLLESGQPAAAASSYDRAVRLAPDAPLIRAGLGRALLAAGRTSDAVNVLERARADDGFDPRMLRDLAVGHARLGNTGLASIATAERFAATGRLADAAIHAQRASGLLPRGSSGWLRAQDILRVAPAQ